MEYRIVYMVTMRWKKNVEGTKKCYSFVYEKGKKWIFDCNDNNDFIKFIALFEMNIKTKKRYD